MSRTEPVNDIARLNWLYGSVPTAAGTTVLLAAMLVGVLWPVVDHAIAAVWLALQVLTQAASVGLWLSYRRAAQTDADNTSAWLRRFRLWPIGTGLLWGLATWLLFPVDLYNQVFMAFVLAGLSAGAISILAPDRLSALGFIALALIPLIVNFLVQGSGMSLSMGFMITLFLIFVDITGSRLRKMLQGNEVLVQDARERQHSLDMQRRLGAVIARAQSRFIHDASGRGAFDELLKDILDLTGSEYGFIGEVLRTREGAPYMKTYAITNIAWNDGTRAIYAASAAEGMEFFNLETLFGAALVSGEPVIANDAYRDPRRGGLPEGHPALNAFLGVPVHRGDEMVAMLGIANRPDGYDEDLIVFLSPLLATIGQLLTAEQAQQQQRETNRLLEGIFENMPGMVFIKDAGDLRFKYFNRAGEMLVGRGRDELVGRNDYDFFPREQADWFTAKDRAVLAQTEPVEIPDEEIETPHGTRFLRTWKLALRDDQGKPQYLLGISEDITERRQAEIALRQARDEAQRANAVKTDFLSRMSHELRTPLNAILGFTQLLQLRDEEPLSAQQHADVSEIHYAGEHLLALVTEVLDLARIESGRLEISPERVALCPVIEHCVAQIENAAGQRGIQTTLQLPAPCTVLADPARLQQVLLNLLSNAIKYNCEGGRIGVEYASVEGQRVRVSVRDTGPGLSVEQQARLFRPFERLESAYEGVEGIGIGLALARRLVEGMQGTIGVDSVSGEGSSFWFELPLYNEDGSGDTPPAASAEAITTNRHDKRTVLYIEDNPANLRLVEKILARRAEIEPLTAATAEDGLALAERERPALILLDINLPGMDGFEALRRLAENPATGEIPVVAVTANAMPPDIQRGMAAGFKDYLTKPLMVMEVLEVVDCYLGGDHMP